MTTKLTAASRPLPRPRPSRSLWRSASAQLRFEFSRLTALGNGMVELLVFPVIAVVIGLLVRGDMIGIRVGNGLMGGFSGLAAMAAWMMAMTPALLEDQGGHRAIIGLIPISRPGQVVGRFLYMLASAMIWSAETGLCHLIYRGLYGGGMDLMKPVEAASKVFVLAVVLGSIILTCAYRFGARQLMIALGLIMGACYLLAALLSYLPVEWLISATINVIEFLSVPWHAALAGTALCIVVYGVALAISLRIFTTKDL